MRKIRFPHLLLTVLLPVATLLASPIIRANPVAEQPTLNARLDAAIDSAIAEKRIVGTVVLVAVGGEVVYERAAGMADRESARPMEINTLFRLSSVTKPFVSVTAMKMVEDGVLQLDDPVTRWLPDFKPQLKDGSTPIITVHQLLTHTSGLEYGFSETENGPYHKAGVSDGLDLVGISLDENLQRLASVPLLFKPGSKWQYSLSTDVLGAVLSKAGKQPLPELVRHYVTEPLNLKDTAFVTTERERMATPYVDAKPQPRRMAKDDNASFGKTVIHYSTERAFSPDAYPSGGAGMVGSAPDFMRFLLAIRNQGEPILHAETTAEMMKDQVPSLTLAMEPGWGFGYGWAVLKDPAKAQTPQGKGTIYWGGVYGHKWFYDPVNDIIIVMFTNTSIEGMAGKYTVAIRDAVYSNRHK